MVAQLLAEGWQPQGGITVIREINSGKVKVSDQTLLTALQECSNIRQALQKVGLSPKGGNYQRANKLIATVVK